MTPKQQARFNRLLEEFKDAAIENFISSNSGNKLREEASKEAIAAMIEESNTTEKEQ